MPPSSPSPDTTTSPTPDATADGVAEATVPLRERAFTLHCEGLRSPAIARRIHVSARTVRAWLQQDLAALARQSKDKRPERLALAVERHLAVAAAAWEAHRRACDYDRLPLAQLRAAGDPEGSRVAPRPSPATLRSLATVLAAQREVARLQGLHVYHEEPVAQGPAHVMLTGDDEVMVRPEEMEAWIAFRDAYPREYDHPAAAPADVSTPADAAAPATSTNPDAMPAHDENAAEMAMPLAPHTGLTPYPGAADHREDDHREDDRPADDRPAAPCDFPLGGENAAEMASVAPAERRRSATPSAATAYYYDAASYDPWFARLGVGAGADSNPDALDPLDSPDPDADADADADAGPDPAALDEGDDGETDDTGEVNPLAMDWRERARAGYVFIPFDDARRYQEEDEARRRANGDFDDAWSPDDV